jgi:pimeloyl-ACP methyl ester carboxylesterase
VLISGPNGRSLDVELSGPETGRAIVFHTGTPDAGTMFEPLVNAGAQRGCRHVAYSRPGYAASDRHEGRRIADCTADVAAILGELGIERAFMIGMSGGGPHALACAALLPERTIAAATLAGAAPFDAEGLDWAAGMGAENIAEFAAVGRGDAALCAHLEHERTSIIGVTAAELRAAFGDLVADADRAVLTGDYAEHLAASMRSGLADGIWGWFDDDVALTTAWGVDLGTITVPVTIWQGREDRMVPLAHGQWLARHVAGARARLRDGEGHLSLVVRAYGEILDDLIAVAG